MDGGGVLYDTKDPLDVARADGRASSTIRDIEDAIVASQDAALARLLRKDFAGTLLRFVDQVRATPPRAGARGRLRLLAAVRSGRAARGAAPVPAGAVSRAAARTADRIADRIRTSDSTAGVRASDRDRERR